MLTTIRLRRAVFIALMLVCLCACGCADGVIRLLNTDLRIAPGVAYSTQEILTLEVDDADYILIDEVAIAHRQRGKLTACMGTAEDGVYFDGKAAYRYRNGEAALAEDFPFDRIEARVEGYLHAVQAIMRAGGYRYYEHVQPVEVGTMYDTMYYCVIPEAGMAQFAETGYANGLIVVRYRSVEFQQVTLLLYDADGQERVRCEIGVSERKIKISPPM